MIPNEKKLYEKERKQKIKEGKRKEKHDMQDPGPRPPVTDAHATAGDAGRVVPVAPVGVDVVVVQRRLPKQEAAAVGRAQRRAAVAGPGSPETGRMLTGRKDADGPEGC